MTEDFKKMFEMKQDDEQELCREIDRLRHALERAKEGLVHVISIEVYTDTEAAAKRYLKEVQEIERGSKPVTKDEK